MEYYFRAIIYIITINSYQIPEERVENDGNHSNTKAGVIKVDEI